MADQVTISTFLELRDNLSEGMRKAAAAVEAATGRASAAKVRADQRAAAQSNRTSERIARQEKRTADAAIRESARVLAAKARADQKAAAAATQMYERIIRDEKRTADAAIRESRRIEEAKRRALAGGGGGGSGGGDGGSGLGVISQLLGPLITLQAATRAITFAFDAAKSAITGMFKTAIHYGIEYEKVNTDISSALFTTKMAPSMEVGKAAAQDLMKTMHDMSLKLPGQAQDYYYVFAQSLPAAISVGMHDMQKFSKFISEYTAVAIKRNVGAQRAATDMQMMLQGRARITTNMFQKLLPYINMTHIEFNKLMKTNRAKGIELLISAVQKSASGMKGVAADALTTFGELQTRITDIAIWGEKPLFQATKNVVIDINHWLEKSKNSVHGLATVVSTTLGDAFQGVAMTAIVMADTIAKALGMLDKEKSKRTSADALEEAKKSFSYGQKIVTLFNTFGGQGYGQLAAAAMGIHTAGRVSGLSKEAAALSEHEGKLKSIGTLFNFMDKYVPDVAIQKPGDIRRIAEEMTPYYKRNVFDVEGRKSTEVFAEYLESRGMEKLDINKVYLEMIKLGAETPLALTHPDDLSGGLDAPAAAPKTRPEQTFDFRHSRFDIKQEFAEGYDPDRIAVAFASDLGRLGDMKLQASYGLAGGVK